MGKTKGVPVAGRPVTTDARWEEVQRASRKRVVDVPSGWWSATDTRNLLGLSEYDMKRARDERALVPERKNRRGYNLYRDEDVRRAFDVHRSTGLLTGIRMGRGQIPGSYGKDVCVEAFALIRAGANAADLVIKLRIHFDAALRLWRDYAVACSGYLVTDAHAKEIDGMRALPGRFPVRNATELVAVLRACAEERACVVCSGPTEGSCTRCVLATSTSARKEEARPSEEERASETTTTSSARDQNGRSSISSSAAADGASLGGVAGGGSFCGV